MPGPHREGIRDEQILVLEYCFRGSLDGVTTLKIDQVVVESLIPAFDDDPASSEIPMNFIQVVVARYMHSLELNVPISRRVQGRAIRIRNVRSTGSKRCLG